ncbi:ATP-binding protein [Fontibacillus sp. BL9]|uniref:ATP-binding protein n=1 Tax=Fontibacillus sp. BL9 TaxID=3389971 RepID=UPI00397869AF
MDNTPHVKIGTHPIETGDYIIPTKEVLRLMGSIMKIVNNRLPGMIVYGRPRIGKTWALKFAIEHLPTSFGAPLPILLANCNSYRMPSEEKFYSDLLDDFDFPFATKRNPSELRRQIVNLMLEKAEKSKIRRLVLIIDEAHRLTEFHYSWLMDIYNALVQKKVSMTIISVGQEELLARRTFFLEQKKSQIIGRFMTHEHHFHGIRTIEDIQLILSGYDSPEVSCFPEGSGWSFSRYFFPEGYNKKERLEKEAKVLFNLFVELRKEHGVSAALEIPMEYFSFTIENALKKNGLHGDQHYWINKAQWREAIEMSGYVESEIYMALV